MTTTGPASSSVLRSRLAATDAQQRVTELQAALNEALADRRAAVLKLRAEDRSLGYIADLLGITKTAVANICKEGS